MPTKQDYVQMQRLKYAETYGRMPRRLTRAEIGGILGPYAKLGAPGQSRTFTISKVKMRDHNLVKAIKANKRMSMEAKMKALKTLGRRLLP